jgi:site-specific recombinase XerD
MLNTNHLSFIYSFLLSLAFLLLMHVARHTFACTVALGQGISKEVLQIMMGHSSIKTTEIYAKLPMQYVSQNIGDRMFRVWK